MESVDKQRQSMNSQDFRSLHVTETSLGIQNEIKTLRAAIGMMAQDLNLKIQRNSDLSR